MSAAPWPPHWHFRYPGLCRRDVEDLIEFAFVQQRLLPWRAEDFGYDPETRTGNSVVDLARSIMVDVRPDGAGDPAVDVVYRLIDVCKQAYPRFGVHGDCKAEIAFELMLAWPGWPQMVVDCFGRRWWGRCKRRAPVLGLYGPFNSIVLIDGEETWSNYLASPGGRRAAEDWDAANAWGFSE
jgi:hypothetical protein